MPFFPAHKKLEPLNPTQHYTTLVTESSLACLWSFWQSLACFITKWPNTFPPEISLLTLNQENQLSTKLVLVSSINDKTSKEILTIKKTPSIIGNCHRFSLHRVKAELVEVKMENAENLKDWVRVSLTQRNPEPSMLLISRVSFLFCLWQFQNSFFFLYLLPTFVIVPDKLARSLQIAFFLLINYVFIPIFYIGFKLQSSRRYWNIYQIFYIWDGLMLLNWITTRQKHKAGCKKINDTFRVHLVRVFKQ